MMHFADARRRFLLGALSAASGAAWPQGLAGKPVKIVVPAGAGTSTDLVTRLIAERMAAALGQSVLVENRAGAAGMIGTEAVVKAAADGTTLGMANVGTLSIVPSMMRSLRFNPASSLDPLAFLGYTPTLLVVRADSPYREVKDLVARAKSGGKVAFSSASNGSTGHLGGELLKRNAGAEMTHVPYKEGTQALTAVIAGDVDFMFYHPAAVMPFIRDGRLRPLAVSSARRTRSAPDVRTMDELGFGPFDLVAWYMIVAPTGVPDDARARLKAALRTVLRDQGVLEKLAEQGIEQRDVADDKLKSFVAEEAARWGAIVRASGAQID